MHGAVGRVLALRQVAVLPRFRAVAGLSVASAGLRAADAVRSLPVRVITALTRVSIISTLPKLGPALATGGGHLDGAPERSALLSFWPEHGRFQKRAQGRRRRAAARKAPVPSRSGARPTQKKGGCSRIRPLVPVRGGTGGSACSGRSAADRKFRSGGALPTLLPPGVASCDRQPRLQFAASICFGVSSALPTPTWMVRGFIRSGMLRTRSTCSRPSLRSAPFTST